MLRVDLAARELDAPIAELAAWPPGPPRPGGWFLMARAVQGAELHRGYQEEACREDPTFEPEKAVSFTGEVEGFLVRLQGRADGVRRAEDGALVVEELKSTLSDGKASHRRQLRLYGLCLAAAEPEREVRCRLVLISPVDGTRRRVDVRFERERVSRELQVLVRRLIRDARDAEQLRRRRAEAAATLRFPYPERRQGQEELETAVTESLESGRPLLAMAPTGIGKTVSVLLAALRQSLALDATLYFLTAKTSQQALAARTFLDLWVEPLRACTQSAKARLCSTGTLLCTPERCEPLARCAQRGRVEGVLEELLAAHRHVSAADFLAAGEAHGLCPHVLSMSLTERVDLVICDYNYVYGPARASGPRRRETVAVVDEAHNLFDRAREHSSVELSMSRLSEAGAVAPREAQGFLSKLSRAIRSLSREAQELHGSGYRGHVPLPARPRVWEELGAEAARLAVGFALSERLAGPEDPYARLLEEVLQLRNLLALGEPELIGYAHRAGLGVLCVDPARRLAERHDELRGTVALSATLSPPDCYADVLGFASREPLQLSLPSPFPPENRCIVIDPGVDTTYEGRRHCYGEIAKRVRRYVGVKPGNHAVFFSSFAFLQAVHAHLEIWGKRVVCQEPRQSPAETRRILDLLRAGDESTILLAVTGGTFAEGIDLPGDALVGAIVVGPCLPPVGFERECMRHHFEESCGEGFTRAMLIPGMQRVIQAAGRVHRRPEDVGTIVLLGKRFATPAYLDCLPHSWYSRRPEELICEDPMQALREFWRDQLSSVRETVPGGDAHRSG